MGQKQSMASWLIDFGLDFDVHVELNGSYLKWKEQSELEPVF